MPEGFPWLIRAMLRQVHSSDVFRLPPEEE
jgi:hypothetical protein